MEVILASVTKLSFEFVADPGGIHWQLVDLENTVLPDVLAMHVKSYYPEVEIEVTQESPKTRQYPFYRQMVLFSPSNAYAAPLPFCSLTR